MNIQLMMKEFIVDNVAATVTVTGLATGSDTGDSSFDNYTNDSTPSISGTANEAGSIELNSRASREWKRSRK